MPCVCEIVDVGVVADQEVDYFRVVALSGILVRSPSVDDSHSDTAQLTCSSEAPYSSLSLNEAFPSCRSWRNKSRRPWRIKKKTLESLGTTRLTEIHGIADNTPLVWL